MNEIESDRTGSVPQCLCPKPQLLSLGIRQTLFLSSEVPVAVCHISGWLLTFSAFCEERKWHAEERAQGLRKTHSVRSAKTDKVQAPSVDRGDVWRQCACEF